MILYAAIGIAVVWLLFLMVLAKENSSAKHREWKNYPFISIVIALRNEESNVKSLCQSLKDLSYDPGKFEILFGDDDSDDATIDLLEKYKPVNGSIYAFGSEDTGHFGKQKILSKLTEKAKGEYLLFTDADMQFEQDWIQGMLSRLSDDREMVVGLTKVAGNSWLEVFKNLDWLFNEWIVKWFTRLGIYLTAWGNNMMIAKTTYESIGGHAALDSTVVEDVGLLRALVSQYGKLVINTQVSAVATTRAVSDFQTLFHQRKRWMNGLVGLNPMVILAGMVKMLFWPAVILLSWNHVYWMIVGVLAICFKWISIKNLSKRTKSRFYFVQLLVFEVYDFVFYLFTFAFYLLPIKMRWKDRKY